MKYKKIGIGLLSTFILSITFTSLAADANGEIWYQRIGGALTQIQDGETHTHDNQIVQRAGDNLTMTCHENCNNNVQTEFVGLVTVIADCAGKDNGEIIDIDLTLNGASGSARVVCQENPVYNDGSTQMDCLSKGFPYTGVHTINFPGGWTNKDVDCNYKIVDPEKLESWNSRITKLRSGNFDSIPNVSKSRKSETPVVEIFTHKKDQDQAYKIEGKATDTEGNETIMNLDHYKIKIDRTALHTTGVRMKSFRSTDTSETAHFRNLSTTNPVPASKWYEAHEKFIIDLGIAVPNTNESGIDWNNSKISIYHSPVAPATRIPSIVDASLSSVSGMTVDQAKRYIYIQNGSSIFEQAGTYTLEFDFRDQAGNITPTKRYFVKIVPSEISGTDAGSSLVDSTGATKTYANNADSRTLTLQLRDRFNNAISNRTVGITIPGQNIGASAYDLTKDTGLGLEEGLSFLPVSGMTLSTPTASTQKLSYVPNAGPKNFNIKSYLPSLGVVYSQNTEASIMKSPTETGESVSFEVSGPEIRRNGSVNSANLISSNFEAPVLFLPIVYGYLVNKELGDGNSITYTQVRPRIDSTDPIELAFGDEFPFFAYTNTKGTTPGWPNLPQNHQVLVRAHANPKIGFENEDYKTSEGSINMCPGTPCANVQKSMPSQTYPERVDTGVIGSPTFALSSKVTTVLNGKLITYPGGNLGNDLGEGDDLFETTELCPGGISSCPDWFNGREIEVIAIEADIEGAIRGKNYSFTQDESVVGGNSKIIAMGGVSAKDIREDITRNAYQLTRGMTPTTNTDRATSGLSFTTNKPVIYMKGSVGSDLFTLGGEISGVGTLIIEDGNLLIENNLRYRSLRDSLGIILINSKTARLSNLDGPRYGNIYIRPDIQSIVGTYFSDGSIMSVQPNNTPNPNLSISERSALDKQLLINGTIFTKNTLGGVLSQTSGAGSNRTPWGVASDNSISSIQTAMKYDLHWLRRYRPNTDSNPPAKPNQHATVIRPDGKVQNITPPGFEINSIIRR